MREEVSATELKVNEGGVCGQRYASDHTAPMPHQPHQIVGDLSQRANRKVFACEPAMCHETSVDSGFREQDPPVQHQCR